jgi:hypothetical protein
MAVVQDGVRYKFELTGTRSLLMHADDIERSEKVRAWQRDPSNKNQSVPGDDRTPAWTWTAYTCHDETHLTIPQEYLMAAVRRAGSQIILARSRTFKELSQSGIIPIGEHFEFRCGQNNKQVKMSAIAKIRDMTFAQQSQAVLDLGFSLFVKRAKIGRAKHIRVRPRFDSWSVSGEIEVTAQEISETILGDLFAIAGRIGIGDWRPGGTTPGPFGMFRSKLTKA